MLRVAAVCAFVVRGGGEKREEKRGEKREKGKEERLSVLPFVMDVSLTAAYLDSLELNEKLRQDSPPQSVHQDLEFEFPVLRSFYATVHISNCQLV